jgi:hypothetical protein
MKRVSGYPSGVKKKNVEHPTSVRTWLWFVVVRDIEALPGKA